MKCKVHLVYRKTIITETDEPMQRVGEEKNFLRELFWNPTDRQTLEKLLPELKYKTTKENII